MATPMSDEDWAEAYDIWLETQNQFAQENEHDEREDR